MRQRWRTIALYTLALSLTGARFAFAGPPSLTGLFPAGAARGQLTTVTMSGKFDHWPVNCWVDSDGVSIKAGGEKGKLEIRVAADARPGVRWVRVHDQEGATNLRPFFVGTLPEVGEVEPNDDPQHPQAIGQTAATVNGRLSRRGDVDGFAVSLDQGQKLVADLEANRHLGSPMDAVLQVVSPAGFVLAQNDDTVGRDPRIIFEAPARATYIVRLFAFPSQPDSSIRFAGGEAFIYRLTLTTGGFLEHVFPLAVSKECPSKVTVIGPNLGECDRSLAITIPPDDKRDVFTLFHPRLPGNTVVRSVSGKSVVEVEPNDLAHPQKLWINSAISGRIDPPGERDTFEIDLRKGEKSIFSLESRSFGLPLDAVLQVLDSSGKTLAEADDVSESRDPELTFVVPADGKYRVVVRDLNDRGGPRHAYLLRALAPKPDFTLTLAADKFDVTSGQAAKVVVNIIRNHGFADTIDVMAEDLPDCVVATTARSKASDGSAKSVTLVIRADGCTHSGPFRVIGRSVERKAALAFRLCTCPGI